MWDLERMDKPVFHAQAHASIINQLDATGGQVGFAIFSSALHTSRLLGVVLANRAHIRLCWAGVGCA